MSTDWRLDVLACPTTGGRLSGTWPQLRNSQGQAIDVDAHGIVRTPVTADRGVQFHELMAPRTGLRQLQHQALHLAAWEAPYYRQILTRFLADLTPAGQVALDVGCDDGRFTEQLVDLGYQRIVGVDTNLDSLLSLAAHSRKHGYSEKLLLIQASAHELPLLEASIDVALAIEVLYYLNERYERGLQAIADVLRPSGTLIAAEPDLEGASLKALAFAGLTDFLLTLREHTCTETRAGQEFKFRVFAPQELHTLYEQAGLQVRDCRGLSLMPLLVRVGLRRKQFDPDELAAQSDELRAAFDYWNRHGSVSRCLVWHCRKRT